MAPTQRAESAAEQSGPVESQRSAHEDARRAALAEFAKATTDREPEAPHPQADDDLTVVPLSERDRAYEAAQRAAVDEARKAAQHTEMPADSAVAWQTSDDVHDPDRRLDDRLTRPTGELGGTPEGKSTDIGPKEEDGARRSLESENGAAAILADKGGYRVKQNPSAGEVAESRRNTGDAGRPSTEPDYLVEGRVFDCYAPSEDTSVRNVWSAAKLKVDKGQTQRIILNLHDWHGSTSDLQRQFDTWPIDKLKEVKAITAEGGIIQIVPNLDSDGARDTWRSSTS